MLNDFYSDEDLKDLLAEMSEGSESEADVVGDEEMLASQRRYEEIVKKYKN